MKKKLVFRCIQHLYAPKKYFLIMRLFLLFLIVNILNVSAEGFSQNAKFDINLRNAKVRSVFKAIEKQSNYVVFHEDSQIDLNKRVSVSIKDGSLDDVLNVILDPENLSFKILDNDIVIVEKEKELTVVNNVVDELIQQQVTGTVTGADDGLSIPGVSVVIKNNTTIGTTTDIDGKYNLTIPSDAEVLIFSFVGMKTQEVNINGQSVINVILELDLLGLEEVVVLGYTTKGKNQITGSSVQVEATDLEKIPSVTFEQSLKGKVAGVNISASSGTPGASQNVRIRGVGSITSNNEPLYVIDGVPVVSGHYSGNNLEMSGHTTFNLLSSLNSSDIESMTILKDASATSAYGARGSNGVIVITTKSGKKGKTIFNFTSSYGFQNKAVKGREVLTAAQGLELFEEAVYNTTGTPREDALAYGLANGLPGAAKYETWINNGRPINDWEEEMRNTNAPVTKLNLSAKGGNELSSFYASIGYNKTESTVIGSEFKRVNGALKYDRVLFESNRDFFKSAKFTTNVNLSNSYQEGLLEQSAFFGNPFTIKYFVSPAISPYNDDGTANFNLFGPSNNPIYLAENDIQFNDMNRLMNNSSLEIELYTGLKYKTRYSIDYSDTHQKDFRNRRHGDGYNLNGYSEEYIRRNTNTVWQNSLTYEFDLSSSHHFDIMLLSEYQKNVYNVMYGYGESYATDGLSDLANTGANKDVSTFLDDWMNASYLGMINYNFQGKYIFDFTYRREGSSRFAKGSRFGNFYAVGAAWNITQEDFMSGLSYINNLRLRGSYGTSGSAGVDPNMYQAFLQYDNSYNDIVAPYPARLGNSALTWEKNKNYDVGIDFGVFDNRISGSFAYFNKETFDLLLEVPLTKVSGYENYQDNVGTMVNKGIELELNFDIVRKDDFNVNFSFNIGTLDNEVTQLAKDANGDDINIQTGSKKVEVGIPVYSWYMRKWAGVDPANGDPLWYVDGVSGATTNDYFAAEKAYQGSSALPTYNGGASLNIDYKGIYLNVDASFAGGHQVYERWTEYYSGSGFFPYAITQGTTNLMDRWQEPGDVTDVPVMRLGFENSAESSTRFLFDGDYLRISGITLGYNLPEKICNKVGTDGINIYARATNYFTWVKDKGLKYDPEIRATGFTELTTPVVKSIIFGLNLNF